MCVCFKKGIEYLETQNINCDKILVSGPSAGAHLASLLCYSQEDQSKYGVDTTNVIGFIGVAGPYYFRTKLSNTVNILLNQLFTGKDQRIVGELYEVTDKINTHSAYSAGMFLETRETNNALNKLFAWIENL